MVPGDGIRYNIATLPREEQVRLRDAVLKLHQKYFFPGGVSGWFKQDEIHQVTHVHRGPGFVPWHRELCNRFEELLRKEADPLVSLHYWDWTQDPEAINLLGPNGVFGASQGIVGPPLDILHNKDNFSGSRNDTGKPSDPPQKIERCVGCAVPLGFAPKDEVIITIGDDEDVMDQWYLFRNEIEMWHDNAHGFIGGNLGIGTHTAFEDPFVFLLHSNVDRLWAKWQLQAGKNWRLDPDKIYGFESTHVQLNENLAPWEGGTSHPEQKVSPWGIQWPAEKKNAKDVSIIRNIPKYDK